MMAEDATPLVEALLAIIDAARAYLPPDGIARAAPARPELQRRKPLSTCQRKNVPLFGWTTYL
jgi:hypothetical protein